MALSSQTPHSFLLSCFQLKLCAAIGYPLAGRSSSELAASLLQYAGHGTQAEAIFAVLSQLCMKPMQVGLLSQYSHFAAAYKMILVLLVHHTLGALFTVKSQQKSLCSETCSIHS